jgi:hypothetical protein
VGVKARTSQSITKQGKTKAIRTTKLNKNKTITKGG